MCDDVLDDDENSSRVEWSRVESSGVKWSRVESSGVESSRVESSGVAEDEREKREIIKGSTTTMMITV